ncbi:MAG: substrate-binding domain-containing protein [Bacillota bacterium]
MKRFTLIIFALLLLSGCTQQDSTAPQSSKYTIGVLLKSMNSQHWMEMRSGIQDAALRYKADIILLYPEDETKAEQQKMMFYDLLEAEPDAILFAPCDSDDCKSLVESASDKGIPVFALDTRARDVDLPYIGADNYLIGKLAAQRLSQLLIEGDQVGIITGVKNQMSHVERIKGFVEQIEAEGRLSIAGIRYANSDFKLAMDETKKLLNENPSLKGIFSTSAVMGLGVIEECKAEFVSYNINVVAVDTQDDALSAVKNGMLQGLVTQDGYEAGYKAVETVVGSLSGRDTPDNVYINAELLTRVNIGEFLKDYLEHGDKND